jgi:hypothetical protein
MMMPPFVEVQGQVAVTVIVGSLMKSSPSLDRPTIAMASENVVPFHAAPSRQDRAMSRAMTIIWLFAAAGILLTCAKWALLPGRRLPAGNVPTDWHWTGTKLIHFPKAWVTTDLLTADGHGGTWVGWGWTWRGCWTYPARLRDCQASTLSLAVTAIGAPGSR